MKRKNILIISPKFYPAQDGLGHYTTLLFQNLQLHHNTFVLTSKENINQMQNVHAIVPKWNILSLFKTIGFIKKINPDVILVQYLPFLYQPRGGINFSMPFFMLYLRLIHHQKIHLMFHELFYPWLWNPKAIFMHLSHLLMGKIAILASEQVYASTEENLRLIRQKLGLSNKAQAYVQKVSSNIPFIKFPENEIADLKRKLTDNKDQKMIGLFGSFHPSKNQPMVVREFLKIQNKYSLNFKLLYIGSTIEQILSELNTHEQEQAKKVIIATGHVSDEDVSRYLQIMDGFIAYFIDGITSRRGSVLAALQHGLPVLSTKNSNSDKIFLQTDLIKLLSCEEDKFKVELEAALCNNWPPQKNNLVSEFYEKNFSWEVVVKEYLEHI